MICKNYIVTGEDVNDMMVMESNAYFSYTIKILYHFLFDKGFSKQKLSSLNLALQEGNSELVCYKNLMFTEDFFIEMKHFHMDKNINIKSRFFNSKNECCAEVTKEFEWFDDIRREVIATPVKILKGFSPFLK